VLQFDVVAHRLMSEYGVDVMFEGSSIYTARWIGSDDRAKLNEFEKTEVNALAIDAAGNLTYLAGHRVTLELAEKRWPEIVFHKIREHSANLSLD
jgi:peptide chain release factor 3